MLDQNKQQNKVQDIKGIPAALTVSDITLFRDNPHFLFIYKKTEKLVSALYLLSSFISDKEPIKWQMREEGVNLLSHSLSLSDGSSSDKALAYTNFISTGLKFLSFLEVSYIGGIISEMNYSILKYEFESLIKTAEAKEMGSNPKGLIFSENFFTLPDEIENRSESLSKEISPSFLSKGHNIMSDRASFKKAAETVRPSDLKQKDKSNRQDIILSLLKKDSELGIKDFTSAIKGCSEKTIQRELVTLVSKGQIKKKGEKRWSRYSLK